MRFAPIAVAALTVSLSAFAADPFVGTWKPNVAKWKLSPGAPEWRKSQLVTYESAGTDRYRQTFTPLDGKAAPAGNNPPEVWLVDGKDHESNNGVTSKTERIDGRHLRTTASNSKGKSVFDYVVSTDGRTLTVTRKGVGLSSGRPLDELLVYEKQ